MGTGRSSPFWWSALLLVLSVPFLSCRGTGADCGRQLEGWDLPADLCEYHDQLRSLDLPPQVDDLRWLHDDLQDLAISNSGLSSLEGLPSGLRRLVLRATAVSDLGDLPRSLVLLDLEETPVGSLAGLPEGLRDLAVSNVDAEELTRLPGGLERLRLRAENRIYNRLDVLPDDLLQLELVGLRLLSLEGLPEDIESFSLERVRLRSGLLPRELRRMPVRRLVVERTSPVQSLPRHLRELEIDVVPESLVVASESPFLEELVITGGSMPEATSLPSFLTRMEAAGARLAGEPVAAFSGLRTLRIDGGLPPGSVPQELEDLAMTNCRDQHVTDLPGSLTALDLSGCSLSTMPQLPPSLRSLSLSLSSVPPVTPQSWPSNLNLDTLIWQGYPGRSLEGFPKTLKYIDLSNATMLESLEGLPPSVEILKLGNTGLTSLPGDLPDSLRWLDVSGTAVARLPKLPEGLAALLVSTRQLDSLEGLPTSVRYLAFLDPVGAGPLLPELQGVDLLGVEPERGR